MKAILEFQLPEDQDRMTLAVKAAELWSALLEVDGILRSHLKHGDAKRDREVMQRCRDELSDLIDIVS